MKSIFRLLLPFLIVLPLVILASCNLLFSSASDSDGSNRSSCYGSSYDPEIETYESSGTTYFVDPSSGSDQNSGSKSSPFASLSYALSQMHGGELLLLEDGEYGDLKFGATYYEGNNKCTPIDEVFPEWVTIKAVNLHQAKLGMVTLGTKTNDGGWFSIPFAQNGNSNLRLRIDGVQAEAITVLGSRYADIRNCLITQSKDFSSLNNDEKADFMATAGVRASCTRYVTVYNNEITNTGLGVTGMANDLVIKNNHIHHNMQDGIQIHGGTNWLIEGNVIHDLDDGIGDIDGQPALPYGKHVDCIHMYMINASETYAHDTKNVTVRGNLFYHTESMDVMINENTAGGYYANFVWENNIFAPSNGNLFVMGAEFEGNNIFRNNTVVYTPNDQWTSHLGRSFGTGFDDPRSPHYYVQTWDVGAKRPGAQFYNNSMTSATIFNQGKGVVYKNIYYNGRSDRTLENEAGYNVADLPYEEITGDIQDYIDRGKIPGTLKAGSIAIGEGYMGEPALEVDFKGDARVGKPDIGALEK
jgi:hypothetical protein